MTTLNTVPLNVDDAYLRPKLCAVCQYSEWPCPICKSRLGITEDWAAKFLGFTDWRGTCPSNKRDREYLINAAIKTWGHEFRPPLILGTVRPYWMKIAKQELMRG